MFANMGNLGYNERVNHIKSGQMLEASTHPFSTDVKGIDTMTHSTRTPYFPENPNDYAPWVAKHGLVAPYGKCQCSCGEDAPVAKVTRRERGIARGCPVRYVPSHGARLFDDAPEGYKTCGDCTKVKPLEEYYLHADGRPKAACKECTLAAGREHHAANREKLRVQRATYRLQNYERLAANRRERLADPGYREKRAQGVKNWRERNVEYVAAYNRSQKVKARYTVNNAIKRGLLPPADTMVCDGCDEALAAEYHHTNGYEQEHWFDIEPLCTECHGREHRVTQ